MALGGWARRVGGLEGCELNGHQTCVPPAHVPVLQGYQAQGNEFSYFMLLASAYLLNGVERPGQVRVGGARGRAPAGQGVWVRPAAQALATSAGPHHSVTASCLCPLAVDHPPLGAQPLQPAVGGGPDAGRAGAGCAPGGSRARWVGQARGKS